MSDLNHCLNQPCQPESPQLVCRSMSLSKKSHQVYEVFKFKESYNLIGLEKISGKKTFAGMDFAQELS